MRWIRRTGNVVTFSILIDGFGKIGDDCQILDSEAPKTIMSERNSKKLKADENCAPVASNARVRDTHLISVNVEHRKGKLDNQI